MRKTSVYLPERLKRALAERAASTGRSEAEVLRAAIEAEVRQPSPLASGSPDPPRPGRLVGIGVGPGHPDLMTVRAVSALRRADRVVAPSTAPDAVGRAETIVRQAVAGLRVERLSFTMSPEKARRDSAIAAVAATIAGYLQAGEEVAFVTLGDPLTYSTFTTVATAVRLRRPSTIVQQVPGIMAFQALAAETGTTIADGRTRVSVCTALDDEDLREELDDPDVTLVVYKGGRRLPELAEAARHSGRAALAVAGELLGMPGQRIGALSDLAAHGPAAYLATVIVPASGAGAAPESRAGAAAEAGSRARAAAKAGSRTPAAPGARR